MKHYQKRNGSSFCNSGSVSESNGPYGKIRGSIQQIIDKYESAVNENINLHDEVKTQSILQYAEHYKRINHFKKERQNNDQNVVKNKNQDNQEIKEKNKDSFTSKNKTSFNRKDRNYRDKKDNNDAEIASEIFGEKNVTIEEKNDQINTKNNIDNVGTKKNNKRRNIKKASVDSVISIDAISYLKKDITDTIDKLEK